MKPSQMFTVAMVTSGLIGFAMESPIACSQPIAAQGKVLGPREEEDEL